MLEEKKKRKEIKEKWKKSLLDPDDDQHNETEANKDSSNLLKNKERKSSYPDLENLSN